MIIIMIFFFFYKNIQKADNEVLPINRKSSLDICLLVQADRSKVKADRGRVCYVVFQKELCTLSLKIRSTLHLL